MRAFSILISTVAVLPEFHALQTPSVICGYRRPVPIPTATHSHSHSSSFRLRYHYHRLSMSTTQSAGGENNAVAEEEDDETLLESVDPSTLQNLCEQYSLPTSGTKQEMLDQLREYAAQQAELDKKRRRGRTNRVESNLEGKARHTIMEQEGLTTDDETDEEEDGTEENEGYFFYTAPESEAEKKQREEERRKTKQKQLQLARKTQSASLTAPPPPEDIKPNEKGERVVTVYSTTDKNDLTGMTAQTPMADMSLENARYQQKALTKADQPEESLIGGPFGDTSGSKRKKADATQIEEAKDELSEVVRNLLATTGAPAFQDDYEEGDDETSMASAFSASPYEWEGFQAERIPPNLLSQSSAALRSGNGGALKEVLHEYELQAIGHDGMAADDKSEGGGHYREVEKVGSFLEGYRKAEERRVARETSAMLLDRLVKEGVKGLDALMSGMVKEGDDASYMKGVGSDAGELNGALVRYLEEAIREQEKRVKKTLRLNEQSNRPAIDGGKGFSNNKDEVDLVWNVTRGDDGTIIETIDPNNPMVGQMLREELEKTKDGAGVQMDRLMSMTVQEKMLLLLKLLRDRVKVEAVIGNDEHARNLRVLAYCLKAANDEERHQLILEELGNSLDSLDLFSDLITASVDYAEARSNDDFMPGERRNTNVSPVLDVSKLQKIKMIVERIKASQSWKASGVSQ